MDILTTPKGKKITLADGNEYQLPPMSITVLADLEEAFDCDIEELPKKLSHKTSTSLRKILWILLKYDHPDMTLQQAGQLVELKQIAEVSTEILAALTSLQI